MFKSEPPLYHARRLKEWAQNFKENLSPGLTRRFSCLAFVNVFYQQFFFYLNLLIFLSKYSSEKNAIKAR